MAEVSITGISASGGLAIGPLRQHVQQAIVVSDHPSDPVTEGERLQYALHAAQAELDQLHEEVKTRLGPTKAAIFRVHGGLLNDAALIRQTVTLIFQGHSAAWAWQQVINERVDQLQKLLDPVLAGRAVDLGDVGQRVLRHMVGVVEERPVASDMPVILVAPDLTPSDTATFTSGNILGLCTAKGDPTSHTAILARALGIPAIVRAGDAVLDIANGTLGILNGENGTLYLKVSEADVQAARNLQQQLQLGKSDLLEDTIGE
jgi:multiphosphoryl transfer protein